MNRSLPRTGLVALLSLLPLAHAQADSLRCGSRLVSTGDSSADVLARCGEPRSRDSLGYREVVGEWGKRYEVEVQEWVYGPWNGMLYFVRFEGNRLERHPEPARRLNPAPMKSPAGQSRRGFFLPVHRRSLKSRTSCSALSLDQP